MASCISVINLSAILLVAAPAERLRLRNVSVTYDVCPLPKLNLLARNPSVPKVSMVLPALPTTTKVHVYNRWIARACPRFAILLAPDSILGDRNPYPVDLPLLSGAAVNRPANRRYPHGS